VELFAQLMPKFVGLFETQVLYQGLATVSLTSMYGGPGQTGLELFDRHDGFEPVIDLLRSGGGVGVCRIKHASDHGVWTPFFGGLRPLRLSSSTRQTYAGALIAAGVYTTGRAAGRCIHGAVR